MNQYDLIEIFFKFPAVFFFSGDLGESNEIEGVILTQPFSEVVDFELVASEGRIRNAVG